MKISRLVAAGLVLIAGIHLTTKQINAQSTPQIGTYKTLELVFTASQTPVNPFDTYLLKLEVTDPDGNTIILDGFFDGDGQGGQTGNVWKARITPYKAGTWSWRTVQADVTPEDPNLVNLSGQFDVYDSGDLGGIITQGKHFKFQNGDFVYLIGNFLDLNSNSNPKLVTTHVFMGEDTSNARRNLIIDRQVNLHSANKANIYFANKGDYDGDGEKKPVTPWLGTMNSNDKTKMNLTRWKLYDDHIRQFKNNNIITEMWFFADDSGFENLSTANRNRLFRYAMARTSAISHTMYVIALEWQEGFTHQKITDSGNYIQAHNPWNRMLSVHSLSNSSWDFSGENWVTFIATQRGNNAQPNAVNTYAISMNNNELLPHIDEEFGVLNGNTDARLRQNAWANLCGGAAGGGTGSGHKAMQNFLTQSRIPFQRMAPNNSLVTGGGSNRFVLAETGHHYLVCSITGSFDLTLTGTNLQAQWFNPRSPTATLGSATPVGAGTQTFTPPNNPIEDWILWVTDNSNLNTGTTHPTGNAELTSVIIGLSTSSPTPTPITGDINGDNVVNILDYTLLSNAFGSSDANSDINNDGVVNILDYTLLSNNFGASQ